MKSLEFWFDYGSTYTYLSVARISRMAEAANVPVIWKPFFLGPILLEHGMKLGPFLHIPSKLNYMWRDLERRANIHQIPYQKPSTYPVNSLTTARIGLIASAEGWCREFTEKTFSLHWTKDISIGTDENLRLSLSSLNKDFDFYMSRASSNEIKEKLKKQTEKARSWGIFGSPTFITGKELFWGDDRLEEALAWHA